MKKIYIIIGSIIAIVITLAFMKPLANTIEDMTTPKENITELTEGFIFASTDVSGNIVVSMDIENQTTLDYVLNNNVYFENPVLSGYTIDTTAPFWVDTSLIRIFRNSSIVYNTSTDIVDNSYYETDITYTLLENVDMIYNLTNILNDYAVGVDFGNAIPLRISITYNVLEPATTASALSFEFDIYNYGYSEATITGTTATLLNIIPFVLISAIVLTATVLIKKEGD